MTQVAIVYHSGYGHTAKVAEFVQQGVDAVEGVQSHLISVNDVNDATGHWRGSRPYRIIGGCGDAGTRCRGG